jgi:hypothetical protein
MQHNDEIGPRPLGRLSSGRLPAVHLSPSNPVICRGPYRIESVGRVVLGRDSRLDAFSGSPVRTWRPSDAGRSRQLVDQRCVQPGPLVLGPAPRTLPNARGG